MFRWFLLIYGICEFVNNRIVQDRYINGKESIEYNNISISNDNEVLEKSLISNNRFEDNRINKINQSKICLKIENSKVINCDFKNINRKDESPIMEIGNTEIENCKFENCQNILSDSIEEKIIINNCIFKNCTNVITMYWNECLLSNSKFISCYDKIIYYNGGIIEFCEFIEIKTKNIEFSEDSILLNGKKQNIIRNCIFDKIKVESYLINHYGLEDIWGTKDISLSYVKNCTFKNSETKGKNNLINKFCPYLSFSSFLSILKNGQETEAEVIKIENCKHGKLKN